MGATLNHCTFIGNAGKDAELKFTPSGTAFAKFSLAVNRRYKDRSGEVKEHTEWVNVVVWGKRAETIAKWITKGKQLFVAGEMQTRTYDDDKGERRYFTEINASDVQFTGSRPASDNGSTGEPEGEMPDECIPF